MGILGGALLSVGRSVGRSRFYFSGGAGPAAGGEGAGPAAAAGTESPGPRPGGSAEHQAPAAEVRRSVGRSVGPMAGGRDGTGGFTGPDISPMGYDPPGPRRTGTAGGRILPARLNQSASSAHPERFIHIAPMSSAGPVGLRLERERPESCPARPLRRTHCRTIFLQGPPARRVHSEALSVGARPGRHGPFSAACCRPPACGGPAGRTHLQTDHFLSGGEFYHSKCENFLSHIISASFRPHIFPIISVVVDR